MQIQFYRRANSIPLVNLVARIKLLKSTSLKNLMLTPTMPLLFYAKIMHNPDDLSELTAQLKKHKHIVMMDYISLQHINIAQMLLFL